MNQGRRAFLTGGLAAAAGWCVCLPDTRAQENPGRRQAGLEGLRFRVGADGWGAATVPEVEAVLTSAASVLWKYFPQRKVEPFVVLRGRDGPIVHYQRNVVGEIVMKLDTSGHLWCQYVYQFSHEFCHILSGFRETPVRRHNWFEETLCEAASLFVLRRLTGLWTEQPPYPNWQEYAPEFRRYAQGVMDSRSQIGEGHLGDFYRRNRKTLESTPRDRALNGALALPLLALLEGAPESWEAVAWLNHGPPGENGSFAQYLERWRNAVPARHRGWVGEVIRQFETTTATPLNGAAGPSGPAQSAD